MESKGDMFGKIGAIYGPESAALFKEIETLKPRRGNERGLGIADMAEAIVSGREARVSADLCRHITEAINAFDISASTRRPYDMTTTCEKPECLY